MVLRCLGGSTIYDDDYCASEYGSLTRFLRSHGLFYYSVDEYEYDYEPVYTQQQEPVFVADPNGTFYLVDCQSPQVLMSFETGKPTYAAHHSEDSKYYLIYGTNNKFRFIKTESSFFDNDRVELVPCDVEEFIRETPEKYLDGGRLASKIKTTEYLVDCQTGKIIDTFCADEVQSYQQKPAPVEHEHDQLISVKRIDYELAFYSSTTRKCLWYLRFARFDAWYETACNWTSRMREHMPYVKPYIKVYQARYHTSLTQIFLANGIKSSSETRRPVIKDEDDNKAIQRASKNKKKKNARKAKKASTIANTDEKMIVESDKKDNVHIYESQALELLASKKEIGTKESNIHMSSEKRLVLDIDEDGTKVIEPSKRKKNKPKKGSTTINTDEKESSIHMISEKRLVLDIDEDGTKVIEPSKRKKNNNNKPNPAGAGYEGGSTAINTDEKMKNRSNETDQNAETETQNLEVPDLNYNLVGFHFVKFHLGFGYLVSKRCICSLHDLMSLVNNWPVQVQRTTEVLKAMELLKPNNWVKRQKLLRDIARELANLHKNGIAHGDLNPHNVYIDIYNNAIIPIRLHADMSPLTNDAVGIRCKAMDCYNMGSIFLFILSNGAHKVCDTTNGDPNYLKDREDLELIKDNPEAYDITSRLLDPYPSLRPMAEQVYSDRLCWDPERFRSYFEDASEQLKALSDDIKLVLINELENIKKDVFDVRWDSKIDADLLVEKNKFRISMRWDAYDYTSICDFLRFIKNVCSHYPGIPDVIKERIGGDQGQFVTYIRSLYPKLLTEVYKVFDKYGWKGTILDKYHMCCKDEELCPKCKLTELKMKIMKGPK